MINSNAHKKHLTTILCLFLSFAVLLNFTGCSMKVEANDLMKGINGATIEPKEADDTFIAHSFDFAVTLFKNSIDNKENSLISPLSVMLALAMTANGANGATKTEMETLLGGDIPLEDLNAYLHTYANSLSSTKDAKLSIANSIWFRDTPALHVEPSFLQTNADFYQAAAYKATFDEQTVQDINYWVSKNTDGMIDSIIDSIDNDTIMFLINAIAFDAKWKTPYMTIDVSDRSFTSFDEVVQVSPFMNGIETIYLQDETTTGFIKPYKENYSFVALLPNEGITLSDYIESLTSEQFANLLSNATSASVNTYLPKFSYEYEIQMNQILCDLGMPTAFGPADFLKLGHSSEGNIYIGEVLHKTYISLDEEGVKAAAVTSVEMKIEYAPMYDYTVNLDRPFVYAIIDNATNLPFFIGTVTSLH